MKFQVESGLAPSDWLKFQTERGKTSSDWLQFQLAMCSDWLRRLVREEIGLLEAHPDALLAGVDGPVRDQPVSPSGRQNGYLCSMYIKIYYDATKKYLTPEKTSFPTDPG